MFPIRPDSRPPLHPSKHALSLACAVALSAACVSTTAYEDGAHQRLRRGVVVNASIGQEDDGAREQRTEVVLDGSLDAYVAYAMAHHPALEAAFEDWRAAVYQIEDTRRLPDPTISYGLFLRRVETRVGPQRHRFGLRQMIPWPGERSARADAAAAMADAAERRFQAQALRIRRLVADAYWNLWRVQRVRDIERAERQTLSDLSEATRTRIEIGRASLADLSQIDLTVSRRDAVLTSLAEGESRARAALRQTIGAPADLALPMPTSGPSIVVPVATLDTLRESARQHPGVQSLDAMARASDQLGRAAEASGMPDFTLGIDYIETGPALDPAAPESGKDPILLTVSMSLPIWRQSYSDARARADAQAAGYRARLVDAGNRAEKELVDALSRVRESAYHVWLFERTLIPQAESSYAAMVGDYHTGLTSLANVLMAHQSVLELQRGLIDVMAEHGRAWALLEDVIGHSLETREFSADAAPEYDDE